MIEFRSIIKTHPNGTRALDGMDLTLEARALLTVIGRSGAGKTTLLRLVAGLDSPTSGDLRIDGAFANGLAPRQRDVAMVFQAPALYPHLNVLDNIAFGLKKKGLSREESRSIAEGAAERLGLSSLLNRAPATLSGGQRQRTALARVWARRPKILLLDEPFASLDAEWRSILRDDLRDLHRDLEVTIIHATHDQAEAMALGTRLAILDQGRLLAFGSPRELYDRPPSREIGAFLGDPPMNFLKREDGEQEEFWTLRPSAATMGIRPERLRLIRAGEEAPSSRLAISPGWRVERAEDQGEAFRIRLSRGSQILIARTIAPLAREWCDVAIDLEHAVWFDRLGKRLEEERA